MPTSKRDGGGGVLIAALLGLALLTGAKTRRTPGLGGSGGGGGASSLQVPTAPPRANGLPPETVVSVLPKAAVKPVLPTVKPVSPTVKPVLPNAMVLPVAPGVNLSTVLLDTAPDVLNVWGPGRTSAASGPPIVTGGPSKVTPATFALFGPPEGGFLDRGSYAVRDDSSDDDQSDDPPEFASEDEQPKPVVETREPHQSYQAGFGRYGGDE
jgi:hypothetical protein